MKKLIAAMAVVGVGLMAFVFADSRTGDAQVQAQPGTGFAAVPGLKGGQDIFGPYEVVENWPKPMSVSRPDHEGGTYSVTMDVFAESPDRVCLVQKGELPLIEERPESIWLPELGPGLKYPNNLLPLRQVGTGSPNGEQREAEGDYVFRGDG